MKKILIANLGNRNITYKGEYYQDFKKRKEISTDFRTWTEALWKNYEQEALHIRPAILDTLIEETKHEISRVIMFSSDQPPEIRRTQDTCFEGRILQRWFREKYPEIQFENWEMDTPVTDNEALLRAYQQEIRKMTRRYPDRQYILCEAGGTAQQKSSLKIMLEYLMEADDFEMYYVPQNREGVSGKPQKTDNIQYRKILDAITNRKANSGTLQYEAAKETCIALQTWIQRNSVVFEFIAIWSSYGSNLACIGSVKKERSSQLKKRLQEHEEMMRNTIMDLIPADLYKGWLEEVFSLTPIRFLLFVNGCYLAQKVP